MRHHRFIGQFDLNKETVSISNTGMIHQMRRVLRLKEGDEVLLSDGRGREARGNIESMANNELFVRVLDRWENEVEPERRVHLYCALLRRDNFEWVVEKATEIGVKEITPLIAERTVKQSFKRERLEKIIREAAEQSGRGIVPALSEPMHFSDALAAAQKPVYFFDSDARSTAQNIVAVESGDEASVVIGPEGGWTDEERRQATDAGAYAASLGPLVLRAETAAIVATYRVVRGA